MVRSTRLKAENRPPLSAYQVTGAELVIPLYLIQSVDGYIKPLQLDSGEVSPSARDESAEPAEEAAVPHPLLQSVRERGRSDRHLIPGVVSWTRRAVNNPLSDTETSARSSE